MNKKAFSLIEVLVATSILSIAVFWVYKMIWENNKIVNNSNNFLQKTLLFPIIETCIQKNSYSLTGVYYFYLWVNLKECNSSNTYSWNIIDNKNFILKWELKNIFTNNNVWELAIEDDFSGTSTWLYIQKK